MRALHLFSGIAVMVIFAMTGLYMLLSLDLLNSDFDLQRMMYRASHTYLLWAGAVNVLLGCYWTAAPYPILAKAQIAASGLIVLCQPFLVLAFCLEPGALDQPRVLTLVGTVCFFAGVLMTLAMALASQLANAIGFPGVPASAQAPEGQ